MSARDWARFLTGPPMVVAWGVAIVIGMYGMVQYQMTPAVLGRDVSVRWPANVSIVRAAGRPTLVMSLHPECPCSRASVHELALVMARAAGRLDAHVLLVLPASAPADWQHSDLWQDAKSIPGVTLQIDRDGQDAAEFGASTSGQVMVFGPSGELQFSGGITDGRGHEGDNPGLEAVLSIVKGEKPTISKTPVYGCSLENKGIHSK
jgi:hypothetical protein